MPNPSTHSQLHHLIMRRFMDTGAAPSIDDLAATMRLERTDVVERLHALQEYHGVVLQPYSSEIWVAHPFSAAPTSFWVSTNTMHCWGNCAWCSLGIAALARTDTTISTSLGAEGRPATLHIRSGAVVEQDYVVHFPIPMRNAWDNVVWWTRPRRSSATSACAVRSGIWPRRLGDFSPRSFSARGAR